MSTIIDCKVGKPYFITKEGKKNYNIENQNDIEIGVQIWYDGNINEIITYKYLKVQDVYDIINRGDDINLDGCYVKDFSLKEYRKLNNIGRYSYIPLNNFNANNAFFDGNINFFRADFGEGDVSFGGANFGDGDVSFSDIYFGKGDVEFINNKFGKGDVRFVETKFGKGNVCFFETGFGEGNIIFYRVKFGNGEVVFINNKFGEGKVDFRGAEFGEGKVDFLDVEFGDGEVNFIDANIDSIHFQESYFKDRINFEVRSCNSFELIDCQIDKSFVFSDIELKNANFSDTKIIGKMYLKWEENNLKKVINQQETSHREKANQFLILKENFRNIGRYDDEDNAYVEFRWHELRANLNKDLSQENIFKRLWGIIKFAFKWMFFEKMGGYGTKPVRIFVSMMVVFLLFSTLYYLFGDGLCTEQLWTAMYYSAITFLTIGYREVYTAGFLKILSGIEGFFGLFLMSYFTVAFARKVLR